MTELQDRDLVHFLVHLSFPVSESLPLTVRPGDTVTVTQQMIDLNRDRTGWSWFSMVDDPEGQVRRYGCVRFARGLPPADLPSAPGTDLEDRHKAEHEAAWRITDPIERAQALSRVRERFGSLGKSKTLRSTT